jgi:hypothetical protein
MTAPRRISAGDTAFAKFFVSGALLGGVVLTVVMFDRLFALRDRWDRVGTGVIAIQIAGLALWIAMAIVPIRVISRLKRVALSDTALHVSNFWREIAVPLGDVEAVDQVDTGFGRVVITLARDTAFGRRIDFSPIGLFPPKPHPIIAELRAAVAGANRA